MTEPLDPAMIENAARASYKNRTSNDDAAWDRSPEWYREAERNYVRAVLEAADVPALVARLRRLTEEIEDIAAYAQAAYDEPHRNEEALIAIRTVCERAAASLTPQPEDTP